MGTWLNIQDVGEIHVSNVSQKLCFSQILLGMVLEEPNLRHTRLECHCRGGGGGFRLPGISYWCLRGSGGVNPEKRVYLFPM